MRRAPSYMPENRQFSQADPHVIQRPESLDNIGANGVEPRDVVSNTLEKYAEVQATPAGWYEKDLLTSASVTVEGISYLLNDQLGFPAKSILMDNWTNQYVRIRGVRRYIPPYSFGWVLAIPSGEQIAQVVLQSPSPQLPQSAAIAGEHLWVGFSEAFLPPVNGISLPPGAATGSVGQITTNNNIASGGVGGLGSIATYIETGSANAAAANNQTLAAAAGKFTYISGFYVEGFGATAGSIVTVTITGIPNTLTYYINVPAGAGTVANPFPLYVTFPVPIQSSAVNTAIVVNVPSFGAGNTNCSAGAWGFQQ